MGISCKTLTGIAGSVVLDYIQTICICVYIHIIYVCSICTCVCILCICRTRSISGRALRGPTPKPPPPNSGKSPPSPPFVVWPLIGLIGNPPPSFPPGVGSGGLESPSLLPPSCLGEASLMRQTIFCGRRFCSETLGCPFRCSGRVLVGTIRVRSYDLKAPNNLLYTVLYTIINYILYTCSIYIL